MLTIKTNPAHDRDVAFGDKLPDVFGITLQEFFSDIGHNAGSQNDFKNVQIEYIKVLLQENQSVYEKLLAAKDEQIALLKNLLEKK